MDWAKIFGKKKPPSASTARDRLMMVVAVQRDEDGRRRSGGRASLSYLPALREELLSVVRKYVPVPDSAVNVNVQNDAGLEVLEMNITLPEQAG